MTDSVRDSISGINKNLVKAAKMILRLSLPEKQLVIMCDASEHTSGFVLLTNYYTERAKEHHQFYAPVSFGSRRFTTGQRSLTMYSKELLATWFASDDFGHIF